MEAGQKIMELDMDTKTTEFDAGSRILPLDGLRGFSLLFIVTFHSLIVANPTYVDWFGLVSWGHATLDIFFVLSGFLITAILLKAKGSVGYFRNYLTRRALRIFPAYFVVIGLIFIVLPHFSEVFYNSSTREEWLWYALYLQNVKTSLEGWPEYWYIAHLWSMSVEEQFYLLWPFAVAWLNRKQLIRLCVVIMGVSLLCKAIIMLIGDPGKFAHTSTLTRMGAIAMGAILASVERSTLARILPYRGWIILAATALYFVFIIVQPTIINNGVGRLIAFMVSILVPALVIALIVLNRLPQLMQRILSHPILLSMGTLSYGAYLLHYPIAGLLYEHNADWLVPAMNNSPNLVGLMFTLIVFFVTLSAAKLMYHLIELPALKAKRHVSYLAPPIKTKTTPTANES